MAWAGRKSGETLYKSSSTALGGGGLSLYGGGVVGGGEAETGLGGAFKS